MTLREILLIKNSWSFVAKHPQESGELFYQKLFELDPSLRPLFNGNIDHQAGKLIKMLTYIILNLQNLDDLSGEIQQLAARHANYGAQARHLITVGQALLYSLEHVNGSRWDHETSRAWQEVYILLSAAFANVLNKQPQLL